MKLIYLDIESLKNKLLAIAGEKEEWCPAEKVVEHYSEIMSRLESVRYQAQAAIEIIEKSEKKTQEFLEMINTFSNLKNVADLFK